MKTLLTGGSGLLGKELRKYIKCDAPSSKKLDITQRKTLKGYYDVIVHCAAYTDLIRAETEKEDCFKTNVTGTLNLLRVYPHTRFIYISTEYVKNPVNYYSFTKLWGEEIVKRHCKDYLIIRTLFKPRPFPYKYAFFDQYTTGDYVDVIAPMIVKEMFKGLIGTVNIGTGRKTMFELARQTKPNIKGISVDDVTEVKLPKDYNVST